jgi:tripartite-type tricarboxylate transporter receptor subunit TctC
MIVPFPAGGGTDFMGRVIAQKLSERLGQQVVIDNRAGANGIIGSDVAAKSPPDGYTVVVDNITGHAINATLQAKMPFDSLRDFTHVSLLAWVPDGIVSLPSLPARNVRELIALAKAQPGKLTYASFGVGSSGHLAGELFKMMAGVDMLHVPYKGSAGVMQDVIAGQIAVTIDNMPPYLPQVKAGKLRALAVSPARRSPAVPDLPTIAEAGVPGYDAGAWFGLVAPAGTPKPIIDKLAAETQRILKIPDVAERLSGLGAEPVGNSPDEFATFTKAEIAKWKKVIQDAKVELQ